MRTHALYIGRFRVTPRLRRDVAGRLTVRLQRWNLPVYMSYVGGA